MWNFGNHQIIRKKEIIREGEMLWDKHKDDKLYRFLKIASLNEE